MTECKIGMHADTNLLGRYLLVVDSDPMALLYTSMLLQRFGYNVCTNMKGLDAFEMAIVAGPSLIMIDLNLTDTPALDLIGRLKKDQRTAFVPVIVTASDPSPELEHRTQQAGANAILRNLVTAEQLYRTVQHAIERTPRRNLRIRTRLPVIMNGKKLDCASGECVSELSEHGLYVRTLNPCPASAAVSLQIEINDRRIPIDALVLYCHHSGEGPFREPGMGLRFAGIAAQDREYIRVYIEEEIMKGIPRRSGG